MAKSKTKKPTKAKVRGIFVTLEGGEGSGKSSQIRRLGEKLAELGHKVVVSREPGGSPGAEAVRHVLLSGAAEPLGAEMEAILFAAARSDHVDQVIEPALEQGKIVISDRFFDSTRAYQGAAGKVDMGFVGRLERIACGRTWPDLTLILDLPPQEGMKRADKRRNAEERPDRYEKESIRQQELRRKAYLEIARNEPERCRVIDASGSEEKVFALVWAAVEPLLGDTGKTRGSVVSYPVAKSANARNTRVNRQQSKAGK
jgi:dTMP kinase